MTQKEARNPIEKSDAEWKKELDPLQHHLAVVLERRDQPGRLGERHGHGAAADPRHEAQRRLADLVEIL